MITCRQQTWLKRSYNQSACAWNKGGGAWHSYNKLTWQNLRGRNKAHNALEDLMELLCEGFVKCGNGLYW